MGYLLTCGLKFKKQMNDGRKKNQCRVATFILVYYIHIVYQICDEFYVLSVQFCFCLALTIVLATDISGHVSELASCLL